MHENLDKFTCGYNDFGVHVDSQNGIHCKEWAPAAKAVYLNGSFSMLLLEFIN